MRAVIVGNGAAGVAAAVRLREIRPDWEILLISGESTYHYSRPALMYIFMGHMTYQDTKPYEDDFWPRQRIQLVRDWVTGLDPREKRLLLHRGGEMPYDRLLIATGSRSNRFGWEGQDLPGVQGLYDLRDLHLLYENSRGADHAVIVGGGLIGIELAEMLHSRGIGVTFLIREASYWNNILPEEESEMVGRHIRELGIGLLQEKNLERIVDDGTGRVRGAVTDSGDRIDCQLVGLTPGVRPNIDLAEDTDLDTGRGVLVDTGFRTSLPDVFAAGDCAEMVTGAERNLIQQVWYTAKRQGALAADAMAGEDVRYDPGIWYNSAKFLDLEYQIYGDVPAKPREDESHLYWGHPGGKKSLRLVGRDGKLTGVNLMGIRYRHLECERWIREGRSLERVVEELPLANFDPEFHARHEDEMRAAFRARLGGAPAEAAA